MSGLGNAGRESPPGGDGSIGRIWKKLEWDFIENRHDHIQREASGPCAGASAQRRCGRSLGGHVGHDREASAAEEALGLLRHLATDVIALRATRRVFGPVFGRRSLALLLRGNEARSEIFRLALLLLLSDEARG